MVTDWTSIRQQLDTWAAEGPPAEVWARARAAYEADRDVWQIVATTLDLVYGPEPSAEPSDPCSQEHVQGSEWSAWLYDRMNERP